MAAVAETVPGYDVSVWYGMFAPRNTPPEIVTLLNTALKNAVAEPKIVARFGEDGGVPTTMPPEEFAKFLADDEAQWRKMAEVAGLSAE
jgi:tripartite-type tricarboxylate transporter receptor subunit TctC